MIASTQFKLGAKFPWRLAVSFSTPEFFQKLVKFWCWLRSMYSFYWTVLCNHPGRKVNRDKIELKIWVKQREGIFIFYYLFYCSISCTYDNENSNWNWYDERQLAQQQKKLGINFLQFSKHEAANERILILEASLSHFEKSARDSKLNKFKFIFVCF